MTVRETLVRVGGFKNLQYPEDYDLCFKFYQHRVPVETVNDTLHYWRDYSSRTSRNDPNYSDNTFIPLKVKYFLNCDYNPSKMLCLWGAGKKGKAIAQLLSQNNINFSWFTNNPKKIGHIISGVKLDAIDDLEINNSNQVILAIADKSISNQLAELGPLSNIYKFC